MESVVPSYRVENLVKRFGEVTALDGVSFEAGEGEFIVVLGPTGAGKTTLLRVIAGLEKADSGRVLCEEDEITGLPPAERDMAMVFQNFSLYPRMTVYENLAFPLRPKWRGMTEPEIDKKVKWAAGMLGLEGKLQAMPTELSGGQQQRVAIGRAMVREPRLFLFDEPLASLDAKLRESMAVEIHRLQRQLNVTMLYVTHDQVEAMGLADRIVVLDAGKVLQIGTPEEVYRRPVSPRVARMLGSPAVNLLSAEEAGRVSSVQCPVSRKGDDETIGIRPEEVGLVKGGQGWRVKVVEHLGAVTVVVVERMGVELRAVVGPREEMAVGETCGIHLGEVMAWEKSHKD